MEQSRGDLRSERRIADLQLRLRILNSQGLQAYRDFEDAFPILGIPGPNAELPNASIGRHVFTDEEVLDNGFSQIGRLQELYWKLDSGQPMSSADMASLRSLSEEYLNYRRSVPWVRDYGLAGTIAYNTIMALGGQNADLNQAMSALAAYRASPGFRQSQQVARITGRPAPNNSLPEPKQPLAKLDKNTSPAVVAPNTLPQKPGQLKHIFRNAPCPPFRHSRKSSVDPGFGK